MMAFILKFVVSGLIGVLIGFVAGCTCIAYFYRKESGIENPYLKQCEQERNELQAKVDELTGPPIHWTKDLEEELWSMARDFREECETLSGESRVRRIHRKFMEAAELVRRQIRDTERLKEKNK